MADFTEFFPSGPSSESSPEQGAPSAPAPVAPSEADLLRQQLQFQNHLLQQVMRPPVPTQVEQEAPEPPRWKEKEYFGDDDTRMILDSPAEQMKGRFNRVFNAAVGEVHDSLSTQMQRQNEENARLRADLDSRFQAQEQIRNSEFWHNTFYSAHQDLREDPDLVVRATHMVAQAVAQEPWRAGSVDHTLKQIAETARGLRQQKLQRWTGGQGDMQPTVPVSASSSPGRRAAVESGGSTRMGVAPAVNKDFQQKALGEMLAHVRGGR